jgi:hypothetical protein
MSTKTETLSMPLMHVYHLTADSANDTGYTIDEVTALIDEHGSNHIIEITVTTPVPDIQPQSSDEQSSEQIVETTAQEVVEES